MVTPEESPRALPWPSAVHDPSLQRGKSVQDPHVTAWRSWEHHQSEASKTPR